LRTTLLQQTYSLEEIEPAAIRFLAAAKGCGIYAFSGEMGAGKTTFVHTLCDLLQVQDAVSSPTFALINEYHFDSESGGDNVIFHLDWYRLRDTAEAINAGMEDCLITAARGEALCFIEWPEKAVELLRPPYLWISIETTSITERKMTVEKID
jgi:tRNA threonylcarbamoyladenosine biosynthesis protein TsaE